MNFKPVRNTFAAICMALAVGPTPALAEFPERTIQTIFPWAPGTAMAADQIIAEALGEELQTAVTLVSTPGAGGTKAFKTAMARPADGYTLISGWVAPLVSAPASGKADWTYADFQPLHSGVAAAFAMAWSPQNDNFDSFMDMMEWGRQNPGELRYSSGAAGNLPHKVMAKALKSMGVVAQVVPYATDAEARKDMQAGVIDFVFVNPGAYIADKEGFKIGLVLSELANVKALFDGADTVAELDIDIGLEGLGPLGWTWWVVHKDTPEAELGVLREAMGRAMARPDVKERLAAIGWTKLEWDHDSYAEIVGSVAEQIKGMGDGLIWEEEQIKKLRD